MYVQDQNRADKVLNLLQMRPSHEDPGFVDSTMPEAIAAAYAQVEAAARKELLEMRQLVLQTAQDNPDVGPVQETLKWGQPAYLPKTPGVGSTLRLWTNRDDGRPTLFVNCQTNLLDQFRDLYPDAFAYTGSRAASLIGPVSEVKTALSHVISITLTYHARKQR